MIDLGIYLMLFGLFGQDKYETYISINRSKAIFIDEIHKTLTF